MSEEIKSDYCIVGGGIAGVLLATKLAASGKKVVILEQGPRFSEEDRTKMLFQSKEDLNDFADYNDNVAPEVIIPHSSDNRSDQGVDWGAQRLFGVGGTALHFEGRMMRPLKEDLQVNTLYGYSRDWPISYEELEPWLLRAEIEIGVSANDDNPYASPRSGPFTMRAHPFSYFDPELLNPALKKLGIIGHSFPLAINSVDYRGRSACQACRACKFCPSGARYSPDRVHVPILDQQPNVTIIENVNIQRLETDAKGNRIVAAHGIYIQEKLPLIVTAKHFIMTMGAVETPRMLLLSAANGNHQNGLGNMGGQLGFGFSDHPTPYMTIDVGKTVGRRLRFETMLSEHFRAKVDRREQPTFEFFAAPAMDWYPIGNEATQWATKDTILSLENLRKEIPQMVTLTAFCELEGKGTLELDNSKLDAFGVPIAKISMKMTDWDRRGPARLGELGIEIGEAMNATNVSEVTPPQEGLGYHPSGATAMANDPDKGVCDSNLKVFGLGNLFLVSNSVFPHMGSNPPTLTIAALALRLAAHLEGRSVL